MKLKRIYIPATYQLTCETIYLVLFSVYSFLDVIDRSLLYSYVHPLMKLITTIVCLGMVCLFLVRRLSYLMNETLDWKKITILVTACVVVIVFMIAMMVTDRNYVLIFSLFIINADTTNIRKIVLCSFCSSLPSLLLVVASSKLGIIKDYIFRADDRIAHCFGYLYYTTMPYIALYLGIGYLFLKGRNLRWIEILVLSVINYGIYQYTTTRLTFFIFVGVLIIDILLVKFDWLCLDRPFFRVVMSFAFPAGCLFTYWCAQNYTYASEFWRKMDKLFTGRLSLSHSAIVKYPPKFWGQYIEMHGNSIQPTGHSYFYIDSGFMYSTLGYGIIFTTLVVFMYSYLFWYSCKKNNKLLFIWCLAVLAFTIVNNTWISVTYNPMLLCFFSALKERKTMRSSPTGGIYVPAKYQEKLYLQHII